MSLDVIFAAVGKRLALEVPELLFVGPEDRNATSRPMRISWSPIRARQVAPRRTRGGPGDDGSILSRLWTIHVEIWAEDASGTSSRLAAAESLANVFLGVAHEILSQHGYKPSDENWLPGGDTSKGAVCNMTFEIETPIPRLASPTRTISEILATATLNTETP